MQSWADDDDDDDEGDAAPLAVALPSVRTNNNKKSLPPFRDKDRSAATAEDRPPRPAHPNHNRGDRAGRGGGARGGSHSGAHRNGGPQQQQHARPKNNNMDWKAQAKQHSILGSHHSAQQQPPLSSSLSASAQHTQQGTTSSTSSNGTATGDVVDAASWMAKRREKQQQQRQEQELVQKQLEQEMSMEKEVRRKSQLQALKHAIQHLEEEKNPVLANEHPTVAVAATGATIVTHAAAPPPGTGTGGTSLATAALHGSHDKSRGHGRGRGEKGSLQQHPSDTMSWRTRTHHQLETAAATHDTAAARTRPAAGRGKNGQDVEVHRDDLSWRRRGSGSNKNLPTAPGASAASNKDAARIHQTGRGGGHAPAQARNQNHRNKQPQTTDADNVIQTASGTTLEYSVTVDNHPRSTTTTHTLGGKAKNKSRRKQAPKEPATLDAATDHESQLQDKGTTTALPPPPSDAEKVSKAIKGGGTVGEGGRGHKTSQYHHRGRGRGGRHGGRGALTSAPPAHETHIEIK